MSDVFVVKRDGSTEKLDTQKIKKCINWISEGLDVNPIELESKIDAVIKDGVSTKDIHDNIIYHANTLTSYENPDWAIAAGRAFTMQRWKETGSYEIPFGEFINKMRAKYKASFLSPYSKHDIQRISYAINQKRDLDHTYSSVINISHKYLESEECIQHLHALNAMCIFSIEPDEHRLDMVVDGYERLSKRTSSLASPWMGNLRLGGNISSCFIYKIKDDTDSIAENFKRIIKTSAAGGGMGVSLSSLRAEGSPVNGRQNASKSITAAIKVINDLAVYFDQGGKRPGAVTVECAAWHRDIETYLEIQDENKDPRKQSFDVFMQVTCHDRFMEALRDDLEWWTFCPYEVKTKLGFELDQLYEGKFTEAYNAAVDAYKDGLLTNVGYYQKARDIIKMCIRKHLERGTPYIAFIDTINKNNPNKHDGNIPCVNLCVESYSNVKADELGHTCNLASIVAGRMNNFEDFAKEAAFLTRVLSNGIQLTNNPDQISRNHNDRYATIGIGVMSVHDWLVKNGKTYKDLDFLTKTFEYVQYGAVKASIGLAKERGSYAAFEGSEWQNGNMIAKFKANSVSPELDWDSLQEGIDKYGIHNSQLTSPAPNTTTSLGMDCSAGVMPVYNSFYYDDNSVGITPVPAMFLKYKPLAYAKTQTKHDQRDLAKAVGAMQKMVDTGISAEYLYDRGDELFNAKTVFDLILTAWEEETKAMYYIRTHKKSADCESCAG